MTRYAIGLAFALAVTLAFAAVGTAQKEEKDKKDKVAKEVLDARKDILDLTKTIESGKKDAVANKVAAIRKGHDLDSLMKIYQIHEKGGLGYGEKPDAKSGVEAKIIALQRNPRGPSPAVLKKESADLLKLAYVNIAMAEIAKPFFNKPMEGKGKKEWDGWLDDQKKASEDLVKAVKAEDSKAVAKAAKALLDSCTDCHAVFRK
jgi:hypothetical protein